MMSGEDVSAQDLICVTCKLRSVGYCIDQATEESVDGLMSEIGTQAPYCDIC